MCFNHQTSISLYVFFFLSFFFVVPQCVCVRMNAMQTSLIWCTCTFYSISKIIKFRCEETAATAVAAAAAAMILFSSSFSLSFQFRSVFLSVSFVTMHGHRLNILLEKKGISREKEKVNRIEAKADTFSTNIVLHMPAMVHLCV